MFTKESTRHAEACRFCWMCRHICPVAGATGNEAWTPRARGLNVSMVERGLPYDKDLAETMYNCTLCDACANDCATSFKPSTFIREARTLAVVENIAPKAVIDAIEVIESKGNIFGETDNDKLFASIGELPEKAPVLLYIGQSGRAVSMQTAIDAAALLSKANVSFTVLKNEPASGAYMSELMGLTGDVQAMAKALATAIEASGAETVVVLNPADAAFISENYAKYGLLANIEVVTATAFIARLIADEQLVINDCGIKASIQEPVKLTRGIDEIEPLKQICAAAGVELKELFLNGKLSRCVGTIPYDMYAPQVVANMVRVRCEDAQRLDVDSIITASPDDFYLMSKYCLDGIKIIDIFALLNSCC